MSSDRAFHDGHDRPFVGRLATACRLALAALLAAALALPACDRGKGKDDKPYEPEYKGPKVKLAAKFTPGNYVLTESMDIGTKVRAGSEEIETTQSMVVTSDVVIEEPKPSGEQEIKMTCTGIRMEMSLPGKKIQYDSAAPQAQQDYNLSRALSPIVGWHGVLTVDREGKFVKLDGLQPLLMTIQDQAASREQGEQFGKTLESFLKELLTKHWGELMPDEPVGPGDKWHKDIKVDFVPMLGDMKLRCNASLKDIKSTPQGRAAIIHFEVGTNIRDKSVDTPGGSATIREMSIDVYGTAHFNMDIGLATDLQLNIVGDGEMSVRAEGQSQTASLRISGLAKNTLVRKK